MASRIPEDVINEISRRIDILDVVGTYVDLSRKGDRWWGLCPFHSEKTPSFSVTPDTNLYYCFGCQKGGGVYQFVMEMESLSFPEAVRHLGERAGVEVVEEEGESLRKDMRKTLADLNMRVAKMFQWFLWNRDEAAHARTYLSNRGIHRETAEAYMLGWAPGEGEWLYHFLLSKNYSPEFLAETGLFSKKSPQWSYFIDRLVFPVMLSKEQVVAFSGRALQEKGPKYINSPETALYHKSSTLFGWSEAKNGIRRNKTAHLCEGNLDVLALSQAGVEGVVAPLGTAFTAEQAKLLSRQGENLILMLDGDRAGQAATLKAAIIGEQANLSIKGVPLPPGSDPADILVEKGTEALKKMASGPINIFRYLLDFLISANLDFSGEAQEEALEVLAPYLESVSSQVRREAYIRQMAEAMGADAEAVKRDLQNLHHENGKRIQRRHHASSPTESGISRPITEPVGDELYLMTAVAVKTEYFSTLRDQLAPEQFRDGRALSVFRAMEELALDGSVPETAAVIEQIDDEALKSYLFQKASTELYDDRAEETVQEKIRSLQLRSLQEERQELVNGLSQNSGEDGEILEARMRRIQDIDRGILKIRQGEDGGN
ncbi:MAG: DNA primase [Spirochaetales bacterium]|nr:DNA primase [Spirochaetales bacterium]